LLPGGTSTAASVALTTLNGDANLRVNGSASQVEARVSDVRLGGLSGTGGVRLEGTNTFAASGQHTYAGTLSGPGALTLNGTGAQTFSASSVRTGSTSISGGGTVTMGTNTSLGSGAITVNGATLKAAAPLSLSNTLRIGSDGATFDTAGVSVTTTGSISAVSGNGGPVTITGGGEWVRSTSAAYAGGTTITGGTTARITVGNALGLGTLRLDNGTVKANSSTLTATNPTQLGAGGGTLDAAGQLVIWSGGISPVSGVNDGGLHVRGGGFVYLTQPNTYTGGTRITANTTAVVDTGAAFGTGPITLDSGIIQPTQFVVGRAGIRLGAGGGRIDTAGQQVFWNFPITTAPGVTNDGGLTITGGGSFQLNAASTYRGNTTLLAGTLNLTNTTGSATGTGSVLVQGGMLTGNGRIGSNALVSMLMSSGSIAPGTGAGTLTFGGLGALAFHGGELVMELGSQSDLITFDTLGDRVRGYGTTLRIVPTAGFSPTQSYPIFSNVMDAGNLFAFASIVGVDPSLQPSVTYDAVQQSYVVSFIPSPGAVALMGVGCVMASRRRRG
ncbi:MAG TPA: hypothetical protein VK157_15225, partial [Phycisphaerales bacterium]|nr:hypothetical protein [Phycisphaerales bacterium]